MKSGIDCVVVDYHTPHLTSKFVESFEKSTFTDADLFVVDNEPLDDTLKEAVARSHFYMRFPENVGYAKACNAAAKNSYNVSNREILAFFNSDCVLNPDTLEEMYDGFKRRGLDIAGPLQYDSSGRVTHAGIFGTLSAPRHRGWRKEADYRFRDVKSAVTVSGSAYFIRRDVWDELTECSLYRAVAPEALGAFLPTPHYYEETFCSYHAIAHGYEVTYYGQAEMVHEWHKSSNVGEVEKKHLQTSRNMFRHACDLHGIEHD